MDLFEHGSKTGNSNTLPLAEKLRPRTLDEIIGQDFLYQGSPILVLFEQRKLPSLILWGPPGCLEKNVNSKYFFSYSKTPLKY